MQNEKSNEKGLEKKARYHLESKHTVHTLEPDYHRPLLEIPAHVLESMPAVAELREILWVCLVDNLQEYNWSSYKGY